MVDTLHQYQQNKQSLSYEMNSLNTGRPRPVHGLGQAQKCGRVKPVNGISNLCNELALCIKILYTG